MLTFLCDRRGICGSRNLVAVDPPAKSLPSHQLTWVCAETPVERLLSSWLVGLFAQTHVRGSVTFGGVSGKPLEFNQEVKV